MADKQLDRIFAVLLEQYGPRHWWPGESPFEVCVGAILTQNTNWGNVEKAIANLKAAGRLSVAGIAGLLPDALAALIRPAGYFNIKAARLQAFVGFLLDQYDGSLDRLFAGPWQHTRAELLAVKGIGPETADSILLYAGHKPSFVVDAYTRRIFSRLGLVDEQISYDGLRRHFMDSLASDTALFNEYHALIVELGKQVCRPRPHCNRCCLAEQCPYNAISPKVSKR
ncbi:endonuclease III domain-containing protein [Trichlorobacter lovleyi]|uniref:endonuclease III domain-containing protein n=1 Tax=Trichlorobacter lovleyi TaxID=313985 RepID=UPI002240D2B8|nr:endonuclease III domain-containing protein [Trichlorobacter lovleyi]